MAVWVGHTVWRPCSAYHLARAGSSTRTTTRSMWNRRRAIWAITRLVLSPSVEATNASACSIPASRRASISRAVPTVKRPPRSSQLSFWPLLRSAMASGSSSRTDTSLPSTSICFAIADPTRPQPTISTNTGPLYIEKGPESPMPRPRARGREYAGIRRATGRAWGWTRDESMQSIGDSRGRRQAWPDAAETGVVEGARLWLDPLAHAVVPRRRRREQHLAGGLLHHVAGGLPHELVAGLAVPAEQGSAPDPGGLLGGQDDRLPPPPLGLRDDRGAGG